MDEAGAVAEGGEGEAGKYVVDGGGIGAGAANGTGLGEVLEDAGFLLKGDPGNEAAEGRHGVVGGLDHNLAGIGFKDEFVLTHQVTSFNGLASTPSP